MPDSVAFTTEQQEEKVRSSASRRNSSARIALFGIILCLSVSFTTLWLSDFTVHRNTSVETTVSVITSTDEAKHAPNESLSETTVNPDTLKSENNQDEHETLSLPEIAKQKAIERFLERKEAYQATQETRRTWPLRGIGYMHTQHEYILTAMLPTPRLGRNVVKIVNALAPATNCHVWTIWVRVNGPEIFAGSASSVVGANSTCHWEFPFELQAAGDYKVDIKVIMYNGEAPVDQSHCLIKKDLNLPLSKYPASYGFSGFKLYTPLQSCCEICARTPGCRYWTSPPLTYLTNANHKGCELFFDSLNLDMIGEEIPKGPTLLTRSENHPNNVMTKDIERGLQAFEMQHHRRLESAMNMNELAHGPPHKDPTSYFVGW
jgi:hypothetical protein